MQNSNEKKNKTIKKMSKTYKMSTYFLVENKM